MSGITHIDETVTIGGDLTVGRIGYGAMQLTGPKVSGEYPDHDMGLLIWASPVARSELERAGQRFRAFREQPTPELERSARDGLRAAISPNERILGLYHPWTSYAIVPLFALANAGIRIDTGLLERAAGSPITLGIVSGYVIGKPLGIVGVSLLVTRLSRRRLRAPVGWAAVLGAGTLAGIGFTVSLLVATLAFDGARLEEAKVGIVGAAVLASALTWLVFRATALLPFQRRVAALLGGDEPPVDLAYEVDPERDHIRGSLDAPVTIVEYGDFECPYCGRAEPEVRELLRDFADVRYVWRHLPLSDVHPNAEVEPRRRRPPPNRAPSGRCTTFCSPARMRFHPRTSWATPSSSGSMSSASPTISASTWVRAASPKTSKAPISAVSPAPPPSSSTGAAT